MKVFSKLFNAVRLEGFPAVMSSLFKMFIPTNELSFPRYLKQVFVLLVFTSFVVFESYAQINITAGGSAVTQNFNGLGASSTATLPTDWTAQKSTSAQTIPNYSAAATAVEQAGGNNISGTATNGIYRFNANGSTGESAVGGLSSSSASKSVAVYCRLRNNAASAIQSFTISYKVEKFRRGSNPAGYSMELFYSTNGTSWTSCGTDFVTNFPADADNSGYTPAPGDSAVITSKTFTPSTSISQNTVFYFAWRYTVTSGSTTSNAMALGVDDVSITANAAITPTITISGTLGGANTTYGTASGNSNFTVSGTDLSTGITITPPVGYQVSTKSDFSDSVGTNASPLIVGAAGSFSAKTIFSRIPATTAPGVYSGNITLTSTGATTKTVATVSSTVNRKELTLTDVVVDDKVYDINGIANISSATLVGVISPDIVTFFPSAIFVDGNAGVDKPVVSLTTLGGSDSAKYTLIQPTGLTATIFQAPQTITFGALANVSEIDPPFNLTATASSGLTVTYTSSDEGVATVSGNTVTIVAPGTTNIVAKQAGNGNYLAADSVLQSLTVEENNLLNQTITFDALSDVTYGDAPFALSATASSSLTVSFSSSDTTVASISGSTVTIKKVGTTTITASQAGDENYNPAPNVNQSLTVLAKQLTLPDAVAANKVYDRNSTASISGTLSGIVGGDDVSYSGTGTFASFTVADDIEVTANGTLTGSDAGNYTIFQPTGLIANITPKALTISSPAASNKVYDGNTTAEITGTLSGVISPDAVTLLRTGEFADKNVNNGIAVTSTCTLSGVDAFNYSLTQPVGLTANITRKALTVSSAAAQNKTYDRTTAATITGTLVGIISPDDVELVGTGTFASANVGNRAVTSTSTLTGASEGNYSLTQPTGLSANIIAKEVTINNAQAQNKPYDGNTSAVVTGDLTGVISPDVVGFTQVGTFDNANVGTAKPVTFTGVLNGTNAGNYTLTSPTGLSADITIVTCTGAVDTVYWNFTTANALTVPSSISVSALSQGNNNGTTTLINGSSASSTSSYPDASAGNNAGAAAIIGALNTAENGSAYFEFTLTPPTNGSVSLTGIRFGSRSTATGPQAYTLRSSKDGYTSNLATGSLSSAGIWQYQTPTTTSSTSDINSTITYRLYGHSGTGSPSLNTANWRIDDLKLVVLIAEPYTLSSPTSESVCSDSLFTYTPTSATSGVTFSWTRPAVAGISNAAITTQQLSNPSEILENTTTIPVDVNYVFRINSTNCYFTDTVKVTVSPNTFDTTTTTACDSYTWAVNSQTYTSSGTYSYKNGCNNYVLNLTITPSLNDTTTTSACGSYVWSANGQTYTSSGSYSFVTGCNTSVLNLTITSSVNDTTSITACGSYTWSVNGQTYSNSGTYTSAIGCGNSVLILTIKSNSSSTTNRIICASAFPYTWNGNVFNSAGTYVVTLVNSKGCDSLATLKLNVFPGGPNAVVSTVDATRCDAGTVLLSATPPSGAVIDWYTAASGGALLANGQNNLTTPVISTTTTFYAQTRVVSTGCTFKTRTAVTATVNSTPAITTTTGATSCTPGSFTLTATPATPSQVVDWYDAASGGNLLATSTSFTTPLLNTTTTYYAEGRDTVTGCFSPSRAAATVLINSSVPEATSSNNFRRCTAGSLTINATTTVGNTITWYSDSVGGTLLASGSSYTTPIISTTTTYYAQVTNTETGCISPTRTAVQAVIVASQSAPTAVPNNRCGAGSVEISAIAPSGSAIDWYATAIGGTPLLSNSTTFTTPVLTSSRNYFAAARDTLTGCVSGTRTAVLATINPLAVVISPTSRSRCGAGTVNLTAGAFAGTVLEWYSDSSLTNLLATAANFTTPVLSTTTTYYVRARVTATGCLSSAVPVTATINPLPVIVSTTPSSRCGAGSVTLTATGGNGNVIDWFEFANGGATLLANSTSFTTPILTTTKNYYASSRDTLTGCVSLPRELVRATINPLAVVISPTSRSRCGAGTVNLTAGAIAGTVLDWYSDSSLTNLLATTANFTTPVLNATTTFYVRARVAATGCLSSVVPVTATVNLLPEILGVQNGFNCSAGTVLIGATPESGSTVDWYTSPTTTLKLATGTNQYTTPAITSTRIYYASARNTTTGCMSAVRSAVLAEINPVGCLQGEEVESGKEQSTVQRTVLGSDKVAIYPNPTSGNTTVEFTSTSDRKIHLQLYNSLGQVQMDEIVIAGAGKNVYQLNLDGVAQGMYILNVTDGNELLITTKLIKQ